MHFPDSVRNLVLVGFMGSGKSSVGREIARRWGFRFVDTDATIRQQYRKSIPDIFAAFGEAAFRDEENKVLQDLQNSLHAVIATGGGIVLQPRNRHLLRALGLVIWLTASEEVIWDRVSRNQNRPLLQTGNPRDTVSNLMSKRSPLYGSVADITVETSGLTHRQVADRAVEAIRVWSTARNEDHN
ncbi:MAG: shikimate kinase [Verrucomicrobia bacterium]|nr:shikimate kinase [Verrucomicrobiota bacterium]MBV9129481.1 shikimate kinase [Verrucomicrobiota bacterium]MBV9643034.1 shikimate kinase [Verrucomicrobiota bacterium]